MLFRVFKRGHRVSVLGLAQLRDVGFHGLYSLCFAAAEVCCGGCRSTSYLALCGFDVLFLQGLGFGASLAHLEAPGS